MAVVEPPSPQKDVLIHPDHVPVTASSLQSTVTTITNDLARSKISPGDSRNLFNIEPPTDTSNDLSDLETPTDNPSKKKECTNCGNLNAKFYCAGCHQAPKTDGTTHVNVRYCTKECQKTHWAYHRIECKNLQARKALFRAAWLLRKMWHTVRKESFDNCVIKAEEVNGELLIHEGDYNLERSKRVPGFYREFPEAIFNDKQDAEACLDLLCCSDSLSHMYMVSHWLLKGICVDVKEIKVRVNKPARKTRYARDEWNKDFLHEVLQVRMHSGEVYAIDFTGAQYGWYEPITEWGRYSLCCTEITRVTSIAVDDKRPLGSRARSMMMSTFLEPWDDRSDLQRAIPMFGECLRREFNKVFIQEVVSRHPRGSDILKLEPRAFETVEKEILSRTKQMTGDAAEKVDALLSIIEIEARLCNEAMRKEIAPDTGAILKYGLTKVAGLFNGGWIRDGLTGRLTSVSLKKFKQDKDYGTRYMNGVLAEQTPWGDLTLDYGFRCL